MQNEEFRIKKNMMIREITEDDFDGLMKLYAQLGDNPIPQKSEEVLGVWNKILQNKDYHIIVADVEGKVVSTCACVIIPNLTHNQQKEHRGKGFGTEGLRLTIIEAKKILAQYGETEIYLRCNRTNPASLACMIKNGAIIHHQDEIKYYTRIKLD